MKRLIFFTMLLVTVGVGITGGYEFGRQAYFNPTIPEPNYPSPQSRTEAWQQDLDYFGHYLRWNRPYSEGSGIVAQAHIEELAANIEALSDTELKLGIVQAIAMADNGHSDIWRQEMTMGIGRIPLLGRMFADGYFFLWATPAYDHLLGAQLKTINGHPIEEVIAAFRPYSGGNDSYFRLLVGWYLETPALVHAVGFSDSPTTYTLGLQLPGKAQMVEISLTAVSPTPEHLRVDPIHVLVPLEIKGWQRLPTHQKRLPHFLQEWNVPFEIRTLSEIDGLYMRYGANTDVGEYSIVDFNLEVETAVASQQPTVLIIDQRTNGGGDYQKTYGIMTYLPKMVGTDARIYVLTSPITFSAAISSIAFLKASGGDQVIIVGEEMGDRERMWGETVSMTLPNSGLSMTLATGLHDYEKGCYEFPRCFWPDFFKNVAVGSLTPDVTIPFTFRDYMAGKDAAIAHILDEELK